MKTKIYLAIFLILAISTNISFAQANAWSWVNPKPNGANLNTGVFLNANTGYACGDGGVIMKTVNGGNNWVQLPVNTYKNFYSISFVNDNVGYACADEELFKTTNAGNNWTKIYSFSINYAPCIIKAFTQDSMYVFCQNSSVWYKSINGGTSWTTLFYSNHSESVSFVNGNALFSCSTNQISTTTNGGTNWNYYFPSIGTNKLQAIGFYDANTGFVVGDEGRMLKTTNAGLNWLNTTYINSYNFVDVLFIDNNNVLILSRNNKIIKTTDGGNTWVEKNYTNSGYGWSKLLKIDGNKVLAVGDLGKIAISNNAGESWSDKTPNAAINTNINSFSFVNSTVGYGVTSTGALYKTQDGGANWSISTYLSNNKYYALEFLNSNTGYAAGELGNIRRTTNAGETWTHLSHSTPSNWMLDICFINSNTGFISGSGGYLTKTVNAGNNWAQISTPMTEQLYDVHFFDENTGFVSGYKIYKTTNGGANWTECTSNSFQTAYNKMHFFNQTEGIAVAEQVNTSTGIIYKTTNAGLNWTQTTTSSYALYNIKFINENTGLISGSFGTIYKTTNKGGSWSLVYKSGDIYQGNIKPVIWFKALAVVDPNTYVAGGTFGAIIRTSNGGLTNTNPVAVNNTPETYSLKQNYPNPFNPATTIPFSITKSGVVKIAVFDMLGRQVAELVNQNMTAGNYEVNFNTAKYSLTSGTYFYKLTTGDFSEVKKMMLVK